MTTTSLVSSDLKYSCLLSCYLLHILHCRSKLLKILGKLIIFGFAESLLSVSFFHTFAEPGSEIMLVGTTSSKWTTLTVSSSRSS